MIKHFQLPEAKDCQVNYRLVNGLANISPKDMKGCNSIPGDLHRQTSRPGDGPGSYHPLTGFQMFVILSPQ